MQEIRIHGYGGQGAVTMAHLLAQAALENGSQSQALPSFGVERRGAPVRADVRISDTPIMVYSRSFAPDILVFMDKQLIEGGLEEGYAEDCTLVVNAPELPDTDKRTYYLDALAIAEEEELIVGGVTLLNIPMLGALACVLDIPANILEDTLRAQWSGKVGDKNVRAALRGYEAVAKQKGEAA